MENESANQGVKRDVDRSNEFPLLTSEEWDVYSRLSEAWNEFAALPVLFHTDRPDFAYHINACKSILMSRPVERGMVGMEFPGYGDEQPTTNE